MFEVINFLSKNLRRFYTKDFCSLHIHGLYLYNTQGFIENINLWRTKPTQMFTNRFYNPDNMFYDIQTSSLKYFFKAMTTREKTKSEHELCALLCFKLSWQYSIKRLVSTIVFKFRISGDVRRLMRNFNTIHYILKYKKVGVLSTRI